jgi:hypothetical protein
MRKLLLHRSGVFMYGVIVGDKVKVRSWGNRWGKTANPYVTVSITEFSNIY